MPIDVDKLHNVNRLEFIIVLMVMYHKLTFISNRGSMNVFDNLSN
jgi:hypothetical protein